MPLGETRDQNIYMYKCLQMCKITFVYFHIYICISLGIHNLGTFYARKLKFGMLLIPDLIQLCA